MADWNYKNKKRSNLRERVQESESIITVSPLDMENSNITPHQGSEKTKKRKR